MADLRRIPDASVADRFYDVYHSGSNEREEAAWNNAVGLLRWKGRYGEMTDDD